MNTIMSVSEATAHLPELVQRVREGRERFLLTDDGETDAILVAAADFETLEILADPEAMAHIREGLQEITNGQTVGLDTLRGDLQARRTTSR